MPLSVVSHGTIIPLQSVTEVRSDVSNGIVDEIEFHNSTSVGRNAIKEAVNTGPSSNPFIISFQLLANESCYRIIHYYCGSVFLNSLQEV